MTDKQHLPEISSRPVTFEVTEDDDEITVKHDLGRVPAGWLVIDSTEPYGIWRSGAMDKEKIVLTVDAEAGTQITVVVL